MKLKTTPLCSFIIHFKTGSFVFWLLTSTAPPLKIQPLSLWCSQLICCFIYAMITSRMRLSCHISPRWPQAIGKLQKLIIQWLPRLHPGPHCGSLQHSRSCPLPTPISLGVSPSTKNESQHLYVSYPFMSIIVFVGIIVFYCDWGEDVHSVQRNKWFGFVYFVSIKMVKITQLFASFVQISISSNWPMCWSCMQWLSLIV